MQVVGREATFNTPFMPFSAENLLKQLDHAEIVDWAPELRNRKEALAFLTSALKHGQLNKNQSLNSLHAIFRIAFPENSANVLQTLVEATAFQDLRIRSEAVQFAIGVLRISATLGKPLRLTVSQKRALRDAMVRGLTKKVENLARRFFAEELR